jgi:hypothetical protein
VPLYPFILLGAIFVLVVVVPPLVAAYLDQKREALMGGTSDSKSSSGPQASQHVKRGNNKARRDDTRG